MKHTDTSSNVCEHGSLRRKCPHCDVNRLEEEIATLRLDLSAERDAVAQYIGERNGLRKRLDEAKRSLAFEIQRKDEDTECFRAQIRIADEQCDTLRTQLAQARSEIEKNTNDDMTLDSIACFDGDNSITYRQIITEWRAQKQELAQAQKGEFICLKCGIRKDAEGPKGDF